MNDITLADLSATYGDPEDEDFSNRLAAKKEFVTTADGYTAFGKLFPHQANLSRLLGSKSALHDMAVIWPTGRGKSTFIADIMRKIATHPPRFGNRSNKQRFLIIVKKSIIEQWKAEFEKYPEFTTKKLRDDGVKYKIKGRQKALSSSISKVIELRRQDKFAAELANGMTINKQVIQMTNERIVQMFSVDMLVIDEVHTTRTTVTPVYDKDGIITDLLDPNEKDRSARDKESKIAYIQLRRLFQLAQCGLKIIMTATPMFDKPEELVSVLSFILPPEKQLSMVEFEEAIQAGPEAIREYLEPRLRGRVSFLSEGVGLAPVFDEGKTFTRIVNGREVESTIKIVEVPMSIEQEAVYLKAREKATEQQTIEQVDAVTDEKEREKFFSESRKALNFVYMVPGQPELNTQTGFEYFDDPVDLLNVERAANSKSKTKKVKKVKNGFVSINPSLRRTQKELQKAEDDARKKALDLGIPYVEGTIPNRSNLDPFRFKLRYETELFKGCPPRPKDLKATDKLDPKRLAVIRRMSAKAAKIIEIVHNDFRRIGEGEVAYYYHPWLKNGGGILLGICFDLMGYDRFEGLTDDATALSDKPRYAFMMGEPGSTDSRNRNIKKVVNHPINAFGSKVIMIIASDVTSTGLSFTNVRKFIHGGPSFNLTRQPEGRTNRADSHRAFPRAEQRFVRRYFMAATMTDGSQTIDHQVWFRIQEKENRIIPVERALADISVDCVFNNREGTCFHQLDRPMGSDLTTYHLHWATEEFNQIEKRIRHCFLIKNSFALAELYDILRGTGEKPNHEIQSIIWTLNNMLLRRDLIRDRFGFVRVLREQSGVYYLTDFQETGEEARYLENHISNLRIPIPENFTTLSSLATTSTTKSSLPDHDLAAFEAQWERVDGAVRMFELERALLGQVENKAVATFILTDLDVVWFNDGKTIFHYMDEMRSKGNKGDYQANRNTINGKTGKVSIRILTQGETKFRAANDGETMKAVKMINDRWNNRDKDIMARSIGKFTVIHNVSSDRFFRIRDDSKMKLKKDGTRDNRDNKGQKVNLYDVGGLMTFIWEMELENNNPDFEGVPPVLEGQVERFVRMKLSKQNTEGWDDFRFMFYWRWLADGSTTPDRLTKLIIDHCKRNDLIFKK